MYRSTKMNRPLAFLIWVSIALGYGVYFFFVVADYFSGWPDFFASLFFFFIVFCTAYYWIWPWIAARKHRGWWVIVLPFLLHLLLLIVAVLLFSYAVGGLDGDLLIWDVVNFWPLVPLPILPIMLSFLFYLWRGSRRVWIEKETIRITGMERELIPHFINTNQTVLRGMVRTNPRVAIQYLDLNNRLVNYYLRRRGQLKLLVQDELSQIPDFVAMHELRKGRKIHFVSTIDPAVLTSYIPSMLLINLLENSFKYGVVDDACRPVQLDIRHLTDGRLLISVSNAIYEGRAAIVKGEGTSLRRTREILLWLDPKCSFEIQQQEGYFRIGIICRI